MRKTTLLWLVLAACCGAALFYTSQKVYDKREAVKALKGEIAREEESIRVLQAEWSYLNQPQRLQKLADEYLKLAPQKGADFVRVDGIPLRGVVPVAEVAATPAVKVKAPALKIAKPVAPAPSIAQPVTETVNSTRDFSDVIRGLRMEPQ